MMTAAVTVFSCNICQIRLSDTSIHLFFTYSLSPWRISHLTRTVHTFNRTGHFPFTIFLPYFNFHLHIYSAHILGEKKSGKASDRFHFMILCEPLPFCSWDLFKCVMQQVYDNVFVECIQNFSLLA